MKGKLYLIPTLLADGTQNMLSPALTDSVKQLDHFLCENVRSARRFVSSLHVHPSVESLQFELLDKDTTVDEVEKLLAPLKAGKNIGLMSESGCPAVADPGALAVAYAHRYGAKVIPLVGPSSLMLALMGSGLTGQRFAFHGYLPVDLKQAASAIRQLERESRENKQTQMFIETPYRNNSLLAVLIKSLQPNTRLCVAIDLTGPGERIISQPVSAWKKQTPNLEKVPATFLFLAP